MSGSAIHPGAAAVLALLQSNFAAHPEQGSAAAAKLSYRRDRRYLSPAPHRLR
jgi:hypothetical protein